MPAFQKFIDICFKSHHWILLELCYPFSRTACSDINLLLVIDKVDTDAVRISVLVYRTDSTQGVLLQEILDGGVELFHGSHAPPIQDSRPNQSAGNVKGPAEADMFPRTRDYRIWASTPSYRVAHPIRPSESVHGRAFAGIGCMVSRLGLGMYEPYLATLSSCPSSYSPVLAQTTPCKLRVRPLGSSA